MRTLQPIESKELKEFLDKHSKVLVSIHEPLRTVATDEIEQRLIFYAVDEKGEPVLPIKAFYILFTDKCETSGAV